MHQSRHAFAKRNRRIVWQDFRVAPERAHPRLQVLKRKRGGGPPQVVASQERLSASAKVAFYGSFFFFAARRAPQHNNFQGSCHHRESLAQAFLPPAPAPPYFPC